jgi:hypothetical protein
MKYSCIASVARTGVQIGEIMATHELQLTKFSHVFVQYSSFPKCVYLIWLVFLMELIHLCSNTRVDMSFVFVCLIIFTVVVDLPLTARHFIEIGCM